MKPTRRAIEVLLWLTALVGTEWPSACFAQDQRAPASVSRAEPSTLAATCCYWNTVHRDRSAGKEAVSEPGLGSHLRVKLNDGTRFFVADNPGLLHLFGRWFGDLCFLPNGNELVFDDDTDIYLLDVVK
jgi:hypothetical protein